MRIRYDIISTTGIIFLLALSAFVFIFYTEMGLRYVLSVTREFIPGKLVVEGVHGCLAEQVNIDSLSYQNETIQITADNIRLIWRPFYLLQEKLVIKKLLANNIIIETQPAFLKPIKINNLACALLATRKHVKSVNLTLQAPYASLKINGRLTEQYDLSWNLNIQKLNNIFKDIKGSLTSQGKISGPKTSAKMNAVFQAKQLDVAQIFADRINLTGKVDAQLDKRGLSAKAIITPEKQTPIIADLSIDKKKQLQATLKTDKLYISESNLTLENIWLSGKGDFSKITYQGKILSGKGHLEINGETSFKKSDFPSEINIIGNDFLISNTDTIKVSVSPTLKLLLNKHRLNIDGTLSIPQAEIKPLDLRDTETLPKDVIFVDHKQQTAGFPIYTHIKLILGEQININAMGVEGRLTGHLDIKDQPKIPTKVNGLLDIHEGTYNFIGQELTLRYGKLIFTGSIDNPTLDIEAVRVFKTPEIKDLTVGAHITGTLDYPKTILFSDPQKLSQEDIMSYLVFGQPIEQIKQDKAAMVIRAAKALNFGGGKLSGLTDKLCKKFGLTEFGMGTEFLEETAAPAFVLGKYLSSRLYVGYSVGLMNAVNIFRVHFKLTKRWAIQSESSSLGKSLDLLYSIMRD